MPKIYRLNASGQWTPLSKIYRLNSAGQWVPLKTVYRLNASGQWAPVFNSQPVVTVTTAPTLLNQISSPDTFYGGDTLTLTRGAYTNVTADSNTSYRMTIYKSINSTSALSTWSVVTRETFTGANSTAATEITASVTDEDAIGKYYFIGEVRVNNDANTVGSDPQDFDTANRVLSRISFDTNSFSVNKTSTTATFAWTVTGIPAPNETTNYLYQDASNTASVVRITRFPQTDPPFELNIPAPINTLNGTATTVGYGNLEADKTYKATLILRGNDGWATDTNFTKNNKGALTDGLTYVTFFTPKAEPTNTVAPVVSPVNNRGRWPINTTTNTTLSITTGTWTNLSTPTYSYKWEYLDTTWTTASTTNTVNFSNTLSGFSARCIVRATNSDGGFTEVTVSGILDAGPTVSTLTPISTQPNVATTFSYTVTGYPTSYSIDWGDLSTPYLSGTINANSSFAISGATTLTSPARIVYTCSTNHNFLQGMKVTITGVTGNGATPNGFNISNATILETTATTFTILGTPGATYVTGGTATSDSSIIYGNVTKTYTTAATRTATITANPASKQSTTSITIQELPPGPPRNFTRQPAALNNIATDKRFTWLAPNTGGPLTKYQRRVWNPATLTWGAWTDVAGGATATQEDVFNLVVANTGHEVQLKAVGPGGDSTSVTTGTFNLPAITAGPTAGSITTTSANISWTKVNNTAGSLSVSPSITGSPFNVGTNSSQSLTGLTINTSYTATLTLTSSTSDTHTLSTTFQTLNNITVNWNVINNGGTGGGSTTQAPNIAHTAPSASKASFTVSYTSSGHDGGTPPSATQAFYSMLGYYDTPSGGFTFGPIAIGGTFTPPTSPNPYTMFARFSAASQAINLSTQGTLSRTGHTFGGWNIGGITYAANTNYTPSSNVTASAIWTPNTYSVAYAKNTVDTVGNMPTDQTKTFGVNLQLSSNIPTRTGYDFTGWNTASGGTGTAYAAGGTYTLNQAVILYAQWSVIQRSITWNNPNGSAGTQTTTQPVGVAHTAPSPGTRSGYTFAHWRNPETGGTDPTIITVGGSFTPTVNNFQFYAIWTLNPPNPPTGVTLTRNQSTFVTQWSWSCTWGVPGTSGNPGPVATYEAYREVGTGTVGAATLSTISNTSTPQTGLTATSTTFTTTVQAANRADAYVRACNAAGCSAWVSGNVG